MPVFTGVVFEKGRAEADAMVCKTLGVRLEEFEHGHCPAGLW